VRILEAHFHPMSRARPGVSFVVARVYCDDGAGVSVEPVLSAIDDSAQLAKLRYLVAQADGDAYATLRRLRSEYWSFEPVGPVDPVLAVVDGARETVSPEPESPLERVLEVRAPLVLLMLWLLLMAASVAAVSQSMKVLESAFDSSPHRSVRTLAAPLVSARASRGDALQGAAKSRDGNEGASVRPV